jgi:agmatinase
MPQQSAFEYLRHGQTPFFRLPRVGYEGMDAVIVGVPWDGGTTYQPGARLAPFHVRRTSAFVQTFHPSHGVDVFGKLKVCDGGNIVIPPFSPEGVRDAVEREIGMILAAGATPFVVGGDHSIALPVLRALKAKHGPVAIVHIDAHLDTSGPEVWGDAFHHGTPFRHVLSEGLVAEGQLHQIGLRATWGHAEEAAFSKARGAQHHPIDEIAVRGVESVITDVRRAIGQRPVYVSFDVDAIDPAYAPGTGTPVPGGLTSREAIGLLRALAGLRIAGMDLVEVNPSLDHADMTCHLAAQLLYEGIALRALL